MSDQNEFYNFQQVIDAVYPRIDQLVGLLLPEARKQGGSYRCGDSNGGKGSSFSISTRPNNAGSFIDHSDPSVRGNAIGLWATVRGCEYDVAGRALAEFLGVQPEQRMHIPKKRPVPKIVQAERTFEVGGHTHHVEPLSRRSVEFASGRGITQDTLRKARCASSGGNIVFPHFDEEDKLVMVKCWPCDGTKNMFTNTDPVPVLFAKHLVDPLKTGSTLIITEGQWDALTWIQLGYPAVSIPSGAGNHEWIAEDYNFLNRFSSIFLDFDDDDVGREAEAVVKTRLGHDRCRSIKYRFKDANDALKAGEEKVLVAAYRHAQDAPVERLMNPEDMREVVRNRMTGKNSRNGTPMFLPKFHLQTRPHEIVIWMGNSSHGKSTILSNQIAFVASRGKMSMVASFEQVTDLTASAMLYQYTGDPDIGNSSHYDEAYTSLTSKVLFYNSMEKASPSEIVSTMIRAHKQLGVEEFVIDNAMTLEVDRQDNTAQAAVANEFRIFVAQYPVTLHLVMHPRKPKEGESKPPSIHDIMGASEWGNMAHTIICVWRDVAKHTKISEMRDEGIDELTIQSFDKEVPDGKIYVRKQRENGQLPMITYFFDQLTSRAYKDPEDLTPMWFPEEAESPEEEEFSGSENPQSEPPDNPF